MPRLPRILASLASLLLLSTGSLTLLTAPAEATSTRLCLGYAGCQELKMGNAGYKKAAGTMWWRMYSGHNCTNYAAYRMVKSGLSNERPWTGSGNASNWGTAMPRITDGSPAVGAVAWWKANVGPAGSAGHVAYVEEVISEDEIVISQDSWGGDFSWARITRAGGSWPSGFVHFNDVPLTNTAKPTVSGTVKVGETLSTSTGRWSPSDAEVRYQWRAGSTDIAKATKPTLKLTRALQGQRISVRTTATKVGYPTTSVSSTKTTKVAPGSIKNTTRPTVIGEAKVDSPLTATKGSWTPSVTRVRYQWSAAGTPIKGATSATLTPDAGLVDKPLTVTVTVSKDGYADVSSTSVATSPVAPGTITLAAAPTLSGEPHMGQQLTLNTGSFEPHDADLVVEWLRDGDPVETAHGASYQLTAADLGAQVSARVTLTKPGYTTLTAATPATAPVTTTPEMKVAATPGKERAGLAVTVTAPGVDQVSGTVRVLSRGKLLKELSLGPDGASTTLRGLPKGDFSFTVRYDGTPAVLSTMVKRTIRIR